MGLFSNLFRPSNSKIEDEIYAIYTKLLFESLGLSIQQASIEVRKAIKMCKTLGEKEGTTELSGDFGVTLIEAAKKGNETSLKIVNKAIKDGAKEQDIIEWWNLEDLHRRMVFWSEELYRYTSFSSFEQEGQSADEAMSSVRKMFPIYGDPDDTRHTSGNDRPLPNELRGRVDKYRERLGAQHISEILKEYSTYNALIREEIKKGNL